MKKIININLSGRVIPIEDSAYERLQHYIESLRRYFAHEEGRDEIINDIESRIAELMNEKIRKGAQTVTDADISEIIASMGTIEDFEAVEKENDARTNTGATESASQQSSSSSDYSQSGKKRNRLYRDSGDKMIGGVCSGIAYYLNIDPAIVRILFAIITFGGFGLGFLAYIIMWIVLPPKDLDGFAGKRLYRNPDDKVIGGVAGGLAAYFGRSATSIRILFAAPLLLNIIFGIFSWPFFHEGSFVPNIVFGSLTGTFILAYIVLWIVLPEASSDYQKMEMRGEKVDVNRIRQNVREGVDSMKEKMKAWGNEVKESAENMSNRAKEYAGPKAKAFGSEVSEAARRGGRGIGHIFGVLFKAFFLFIAGSIAFALFIGLIGILIGGISVWPLKNFLLDGFWQHAFGWGTLVLFLGVPLVGFIVWLLRRIMRVKSQSNYLGWTFGGLWTLGWISVSLFVASLVSDFRMSNYRTPAAVLPITQPVNGRMIVQVNEPEIHYSGSIPWMDIDGKGIDITRDTFTLANVKLRVEMSSSDQYKVEVKKYSRGNTPADAEKKAQETKFNISYMDSILDVGSGYSLSKNTKFRGQEVIVIIYVPVGKKIRFDETVNKIHTFNIRIGDYRKRSSRRWDRDWDDNDYYFDYRINTDYTMNANGQLTDPDGVAAPGNTTIDNNYRYKGDTISNDERLRQELENERKKREESDRKIRELEEKQKNVQPQSTTLNKSLKEKTKKVNGMVARGPSTVSSMTEWF